MRSAGIKDKEICRKKKEKQRKKERRKQVTKQKCLRQVREKL
jgi:hypothetical protein